MGTGGSRSPAPLWLCYPITHPQRHPACPLPHWDTHPATSPPRGTEPLPLWASRVPARGVPAPLGEGAFPSTIPAGVKGSWGTGVRLRGAQKSSNWGRNHHPKVHGAPLPAAAKGLVRGRGGGVKAGAGGCRGVWVGAHSGWRWGAEAGREGRGQGSGVPAGASGGEEGSGSRAPAGGSASGRLRVFGSRGPGGWSGRWGGLGRPGPEMGSPSPGDEGFRGLAGASRRLRGPGGPAYSRPG